jgi:anti-sigma-K factor RskA
VPRIMMSAPDNPALIERLAAEYVLGTLRGGARRRLERWRALSEAVDARCRFWEERLMPLYAQLKPSAPPARVWQAIEQRLQLRPPAAAHRWRSLALAASVVLVLMLAALWYWRTGIPRTAEVASISAPGGPLLWQVELSGSGGTVEHLTVRSSASASHPSGHDYELWALPKGGKPVSLGVLPYQAADAQHALTPAQQQALANAAQVAVSIEPTGGSPTGQPTGTVVFVVPLQRVS